MKKICALIISSLLIFSACDAQQTAKPPQENPPPISTTKLFAPISNALARVTKKPFGIKVSPGNSPIKPEKFSGYHTGVDFETTPEEADADVPISAICTGKILSKRSATGYGGITIQACKINDRDVTIIYGHLKLSSIAVKVGDTLEAGQKFALLGKGYSNETSGERKHLHLGIHKGAAINILGYVNASGLLSSWLDVTKYLQ